MAKTKTNAVDESKFLLSTLRNECKELFGISTATFDGVTSGLDSDGEYTIDEISNKINAWLKSPAIKGGKK